MAIMNCPECGKEISDKAANCPNCGFTLQEERTPLSPQQNITPATRPKKKKGCLFFILFLVIVFGAIGAFIATQDDLFPSRSNNETVNSELITMKEYNQIATGMTFDEVKEIVGSAGEISAQSKVNDIEIIIVTWYGNKLTGANANVTFTNGEVTGKAQVGLN